MRKDTTLIKSLKPLLSPVKINHCFQLILRCRTKRLGAGQAYHGKGSGTEPGTASAATQAQIANIAARPFLWCLEMWMKG